MENSRCRRKIRGAGGTEKNSDRLLKEVPLFALKRKGEKEASAPEMVTKRNGRGKGTADLAEKKRHLVS